MAANPFDVLAALESYPDYFSNTTVAVTMALSVVTAFLIFYLKRSKKIPDDLRPPRTTLLEHIYAVCLVYGFVANVYYKVSMGWEYLGYMLYPCHVLSLCYLYVLWGPNYKIGFRTWNICIFFMQFVFLALALPDTSDVVFPFQVETYWIQHLALFTTPWVVIWTNRYPLDRDDFHWLWRAVAVGVLFAWVVQLGVSRLLRINIGYTLWPPPGLVHGSIVSGPHYHVTMTFVLSGLALIYGYPFVWFMQWTARTFSPYYPSKAAASKAAVRKAK
jgi:hypothetical protein